MLVKQPTPTAEPTAMIPNGNFSTRHALTFKAATGAMDALPFDVKREKLGEVQMEAEEVVEDPSFLYVIPHSIHSCPCVSAFMSGPKKE